MKIAFLFLLSFFCLNSFADQTSQGQNLYQEHCSECHQKDGNSSDENIPNIAQFSAILIYDILDQFKSNDRPAHSIKTKAGKMTDMAKISQTLKTSDIEKIANYLSTQKFKPAPQPFDKTLAEIGKALHLDLCENCHVDQATNPIEDAPILRGQWKPYLQRQFEQLTNRERYAPKRMKKRFRKLTDDDKKALIEFYISTQTTH